MSAARIPNPYQQVMGEESKEQAYTEIKIAVYGTNCMHYCTHIAAVLKDVVNKESFLIEFGSSLSDKKSTVARHLSFAKEAEENECCTNSVTLYSQKSLKEFTPIFAEKFKHEQYDFCSNNCSDAIDFVLNYFFPDAMLEKGCYTAFQLLFCFGFVGSFGLLNCFPAPPFCITTPKDVFSKAQLLSIKHGKCDYPLLESKSITQELIEFKIDDKHNKPVPIIIPDKELIKEDELNAAVRSGNRSEVRKLLEAKADVNLTLVSPHQESLPAFFEAVQSDHDVIVNLLIEHKVDVNSELKHGVETENYKFTKGTTALMIAAMYHDSDVGMLKILCQAEADIAKTSASGATALHWAAGTLNPHSLTFLLSKKMDPNIKNHEGETPLMFAKRVNKDKDFKPIEALLAPTVKLA